MVDKAKPLQEILITDSQIAQERRRSARRAFLADVAVLPVPGIFGCGEVLRP